MKVEDVVDLVVSVTEKHINVWNIFLELTHGNGIV